MKGRGGGDADPTCGRVSGCVYVKAEFPVFRNSGFQRRKVVVEKYNEFLSIVQILELFNVVYSTDDVLPNQYLFSPA